MNSFYASVEILERPELKNFPTAVCGDPENRHGIILAKNDEAKKFGVATAENHLAGKAKMSRASAFETAYAQIQSIQR